MDFCTQESNGTRKFFEMAVPIVNALDNGYTLYLDEYGTYLHPSLAKALVSLFKSDDNRDYGAWICRDTDLWRGVCWLLDLWRNRSAIALILSKSCATARNLGKSIATAPDPGKRHPPVHIKVLTRTLSV